MIGIGGLGHLAVRLAEALGATVTVITRSAAKLRRRMSWGETCFTVDISRGYAAGRLLVRRDY